MKTALCISMLVLTFLSCQNNKSDGFEPVQFNSFNEWWSYQNKEIDLSSDFDGRSATNLKLTKEAFLDSLKTGKYIPVKHLSSTQEQVYVLQKLKKTRTIL